MELILNFGTKLIVNVFELYVLYRYMGTFFAGRLRRPRFLAALIGVKLVMTLFVDYLVPYVWINILTSLCIIFFMTCCYESTHNKRIMISIFLIILLMLSEAVIALATGIGGYHILSKAENHQTVELFASRLIFWLMFLLIRRFRNINTDIHLPVRVWVLATVLVVVTLLQMMFLYSDTTLDKRIASIWLMGTGATIYLLIYLYDTLTQAFIAKEKSDLIREEREYYHREVELLEQSHEEMKNFCHDLKNRMLVVQNLAAEEELEELKRYVAHISEKLASVQIYSQSGNPAIDSILNSKLHQAKEKHIEVKAEIAIPQAVIADEDDMVVILGNLLDNAIEAAERCGQNKRISIQLVYQKGCLYLNVQNSYDRILVQEKGRLLTRKADKIWHGRGIQSVGSTVEKYHGIMELSHDEEQFTVDVMMYVQAALG